MRDGSRTPCDEQNPGGQTRITRAEYNKMTPTQQGLVSYMQGAWNKNVPERNPYRKGTKQWREWIDGQHRGVLIAQESDDE